MSGGDTLLLTGGSGMVGRNILEHPGIADWNVLAPSRAELDLAEAGAVEAYLAEHKPDVVIHAAGLVGGIHANMTRPVAFLEVNAAIGLNVVMSAYRNGVRRFLNLGSTCMYPRDAPSPLREEMILTGELEPTNEGYAIAKIMAARLCQYIRREDPDAMYKTLIPCNLFGRHDIFDPARSHLVPAIIHKMHNAMKNRERTVEIWGDGAARREFMYAADMAGAALRAASEIDALPDLMNVGPGHDRTIDEYYAAVARVIGWDGKFVHDLDRPVGMTRKLGATDRLRQWGWSAPTSLEEGLSRTYRFYLERAGS